LADLAIAGVTHEAARVELAHRPRVGRRRRARNAPRGATTDGRTRLHASAGAELLAERANRVAAAILPSRTLDDGLCNLVIRRAHTTVRVDHGLTRRRQITIVRAADFERAAHDRVASPVIDALFELAPAALAETRIAHRRSRKAAVRRTDAAAIGLSTRPVGPDAAGLDASEARAKRRIAGADHSAASTVIDAAGSVRAEAAGFRTGLCRTELRRAITPTRTATPECARAPSECRSSGSPDGAGPSPAAARSADG